MNNVPTLRFKEFSEEWKKQKIGQLTKLTDGVHFTPTYVESGVPFWSVETVVSNAKPKYITEEAYNEAIKRCYPQYGDILLTRIGTLARPKLVDWNEPFSIYVSLALIKSSSKFNSKFCKYYLETEYYRKDFLSKSLLTATPQKINMEDLKHTKLSLPSQKEQEKIASFFSLIDKKIELQTEKVEELKNYKKGIMQKIFSQELRFKDENGNEYPEWEEKKLGELFSIKAGGDINSHNVSKEMTEKNIYSVYANALTNKGLYGYTDTFKVEGNTITVTGRGDIGYAIARNNRYYPIVRLLILSPLCKLSTIFFENVINFTNIFVESTGVPQLTSPQLSQVKVNVPVFQEQNKIAEIFLVIDNKIEKEQEKLNYLNQYKKGLLQQMFI